MLTEEQLLNLKFMDDYLTESAKTMIPNDVKKYLSSKANRRKLLENYGEKAYLLPKQLKFPVINYKTGEYDCRLIYAARIRAKQFAGRKPGYNTIAATADKLYKSNSCALKLNVQIHEHKEEYDLLELVENLSLDFSKLGVINEPEGSDED